MECTVCAEVSEYFGLPECEHNDICSLCWYKMTTMLKTSQCPVCRNECKTIFIVSNLNLRFEEINVVAWGDQIQGFFKDMHSGMFFESKVELARLSSLRKIICLICKIEMRNLTDYKNHAKNVHDKFLCEQCAQSSKLFPSEQILFETIELINHKNALHKKCNVCSNYFYDSINLVAHVKQCHSYCEFCQLDQGLAFIDYQSLEKHYLENHFLCPQYDCKRLKCFVFKKYEDLQDHFLKQHPNQPVPNPAFDLKLPENESNHPLEDPSLNRNQTPEGQSQTINIKVPDYSKSISRQFYPCNQLVHSPQSQLIDQVQFKEKINTSQISEKPKEPNQFYDNIIQNKSLAKPTLIDTNISMLNNGSITKEVFLNNIKNSISLLDENLITKLKTEINSTSFSEFIIYQLGKNLNQSFQMDKKNNDYWKEEKISPQFNKSINVTKSLDIKTMDIILRNINLLNARIINERKFIECLKDLLNEDQVQSAIEIISANLNSSHNLKSICNQLQGLFEKSSYKGNYVRNSDRCNFGYSLSQNFNSEPSYSFNGDLVKSDNEEKVKLEENLIENLDLYNSQLISLTEFVRSFADVTKPDMREFVLEIIIKNSNNSRVIIDKLRDIFAQANRESRSIANEKRARRGVGRYNRY